MVKKLVEMLVRCVDQDYHVDFDYDIVICCIDTLQEMNISPLIFGIFESMTFLNNQVGYVLEGK